MIYRKRIGWLALGLMLSLGAVMAQGQNTPAKPVTNADQREPVQTAAGAETKKPTASGEQKTPAQSGPGAEEEIQQAIDHEDSVHATMERFVPSEKLSEDQAVSFPNDI